MKPTLSPSDAALSVFAFTKRQPQFVMRYYLLNTVVVALTFLFYAVTGLGASIVDLVTNVPSGNSANLKSIEEVFAKIAGPMAILLVLSTVTEVCLLGLALRKTVRNEENGPLGLQLGQDEGNLVIATIALGFAYASVPAVGLVLSGATSALNPVVSVILGSALVLFIFYGGIRLSQFGVVAVATGKFNLDAIWKRTQGQFWRFAGAYVLWFIVAMVISMLVQFVGNAIAGALGAKAGQALPTSLAEFFSLGCLIYTFLNGAVNGFMQLSAVCVGAYAWHQMGGDAASVEEVF